MFFSSFKSELLYKKSMVVFILAALFLLIGTFVQYTKSEKLSHNDFSVYYKASERFQSGDWKSIYTRKDGPYPFRYVPYTFPGISWMQQFPEQVSRKMWLVIQALGFLAGFLYLYKSLVLIKAKFPLLVVSLTVLLTFRQYMDSLYSGQLAGLVFFSFSLGLYFHLRKKFELDGLANSFATSVKILPGFLLLLGFIKTEGSFKKLKFVGIGFLLFTTLNLITYWWLKYHQADHYFLQLWGDWLRIVWADSEYFDGSTPKSQCLRSFILRTFGKSESSEYFWKISVVFSTLFLIFHWVRNTSQNALQNAYSYCLGIMAFILLMPESLPYQVMNVAIPFAVFISDPKIKSNKFFKITFLVFVIFISFASTDFIGRRAADMLNSHSLAFFVLCLLSFIMIRESRTTNQVVKI